MMTNSHVWRWDQLLLPERYSISITLEVHSFLLLDDSTPVREQKVAYWRFFFVHAIAVCSHFKNNHSKANSMAVIFIKLIMI